MLKPTDKVCGFLHFVCGTLAVLAASAVPLYGYELAPTASASNLISLVFLWGDNLGAEDMLHIKSRWQ